MGLGLTELLVIVMLVLVNFAPAGLFFFVVYRFWWKPQRSSPSVPASWYADPTTRHEVRFWDGRQWTAAVADNGAIGTDVLQADVTADGPRHVSPRSRPPIAVAVGLILAGVLLYFLWPDWNPLATVASYLLVLIGAAWLAIALSRI